METYQIKILPAAQKELASLPKAILKDILTVLVIRIGHRREVYREI